MTKFEYLYRITLDDGKGLTIVRPEPMTSDRVRFRFGPNGVFIIDGNIGDKACAAYLAPIRLRGLNMIGYDDGMVCPYCGEWFSYWEIRRIAVRCRPETVCSCGKILDIDDLKEANDNE